MTEKLIIEVTVLNVGGSVFRQYRMDHNDRAQCKVLGEQCRNAFEGGQEIRTKPILEVRRVY